MVAPVSQANFEALAHAVGHPEWIEDPRFRLVSQRIENFDDLLAEVELWALDRAADACVEIIESAGCPCTRYRTVAESMAEPHVAARGAAVEVDDGGGPFLVANCPMRYSDADVGARPRVPDLDEHGEELTGSN